MSDLNSVSLIGNVTRDPEMKSDAKDGWTVARFGLAVEGFGIDVVHFFNVAAWNATAENAERNVHKGRRVGISGRLEQNRWTTDDGENRSTVEVIATDIYYLGPRKDGPADES